MKSYLLVALLLCSGVFYAQKPKMAAKNQMSQEQQMTSEQKAQLQLKRMTLSLDLNEKQQKEVYPLLLKNIEKREKKMAAIREKRAKNEKLTADERYELQNERLDNQIEMKKDLEKILSPEQMTKFENNQKGMRQGMQKRKNSRNNSNN